VDCSVIATSSSLVPGFSRPGQWNITIDAPASSSSLLVRGDVQVAWTMPFGHRRHQASPSCALVAPLPSPEAAPPDSQMQSCLISVNMLSLFRSDTCQVMRAACDSYLSSR
jgi:hypothetical protein